MSRYRDIVCGNAAVPHPKSVLLLAAHQRPKGSLRYALVTRYQIHVAPQLARRPSRHAKYDLSQAESQSSEDAA